MEPRILLFVIFGAAIGGSIWLEKRLEGTSLSIPIVYVALGWLLFSLPLDLGWLSPAFDAEQTIAVEYISEIIVILSLVSLGLSIDRKFSWSNWKQVLPLLLVTMPLCIAAIAFLSWWLLGLSLAGAILLGACLSPTDPVLARAVQVGPPGDAERDDVRFNLSTEAGFNDSLAFPFVYLAMALASDGDGLLFKWFGVDVLWKITAGIAVGLAVGKVGSWLAFKRGKNPTDSGAIVDEGSAGLLVVSALLLAYGLGELVNGYGFLSVFIAAVTAKQQEISSSLHKRTHSFVDQIERVTMVIILIGFGGLLASGVLNSLTWPAVVLGSSFLLVVRPLAGLVGMIGSALPWPGRAAVAFLGVRGVGSFYYLSYGQHHAEFDKLPLLWSAVSFTVLLSIILHGVTASKILKKLGKTNRIHREKSAETV
ncbi:cation:proton antiporter [Luteolibacter algae]|uniref:Cation:proton antiporter n=1 Tax=Luteolibacter algae TaxID=454151 RepID=A0ABW5D5Y9_9BACT